MPLKFATRRAAAKQNRAKSTRSAVDEIRRTTGEMLNGFMTARLAQSKVAQIGLRKEDLTRAKTVRLMLNNFRIERETNSRQLRENLQNYMDDVHNFVVGSMREADRMLHEIAAKRQKSATALMKSLLRTHKSNVRSERKELHELRNAREEATREVQSNLHKFANGLHHDVSAFRSELREQLGMPIAKPAKAAKTATSPAAKAAKQATKSQKVKAAELHVSTKSKGNAAAASKVSVRKTSRAKK